MKKVWRILALAALVLALGIFSAPGGFSALAEGETATEGEAVVEVEASTEVEAAADDWTVLFYFCGSDLESEYGYATGNLAEIGSVHYPDCFLETITSKYGEENTLTPSVEPGRVNILIETGGSGAWRGEELGLDIAEDALQRWRFGYYPYGGEADGPRDGFELVETLPLQSMAAPETLADFIRWGTQTYPAQKYALVLWDHGGGAGTGLFVDELFGGDVMYLYELRQALADGGAHFETVVIDACLMANIETAWSVKDHADWLVASEEIVPGKGTAVGDWLQQLVTHADCDGEWLGRCVCEMTGVKYANEEDDLGKQLLTWSVIDLSEIDGVMAPLERFFELLDDAMKRYPMLAAEYAHFFAMSNEYGDGSQDMRDLANVFFYPGYISAMDIGLRNEILDALAKAVAYVVRGSGRSSARGLSICYPVSFDGDALDIYAKNFPVPAYLAYLDAITDWTAPDWVYEQVERPPEVDDIEEFRYSIIKRTTDDGMPAIGFDEPPTHLVGIFYRLYRLDEDTGEVIRLGRTFCDYVFTADGNVLFRAAEPTRWPSVDRELLCIDLIELLGTQELYNVPVQIGSQNHILRCGRNVFYENGVEARKGDYEIYGVWEGYDENSELMSRSVKSLAMLAGQEYRFLYPVDVKGGGRARYLAGEPMTMYRALSVKERPLPAGTYYVEYELQDTFLRSTVTERFEFQWDGKQMTFPEGFVWEGEATRTE